MKVQGSILYYLQKKGRGRFVFASDLIKFGNAAAVRKALSRLKDEGELLTITRGVYFYPKIDNELGALFPSPEEVAYAIAKKDGVIITPTEQKALNVTGISTQVPINFIYLSNGRTKTIKYGRIKITFKSASPRRAVTGKKDLGIIVRAMEGIEEANFTESQKQTFLDKLSIYTKKELSIVAAKSPRWIADLISEVIRAHYEKMDRTR
jgi:predicted transcriptional regulator of viral defense system